MLKKLFVLASLFSICSLKAGVIPDVAINSISTEYTSGVDQRRATNMVNGVGLLGDAHVNIAPGAMWLTSPTTNGALTNAFVTFDLGSAHSLSQMKVWNYNEAASGVNILTRRGIKTGDIAFAGEDQVFTTGFPNQSFTRAPGSITNFGQVISLGGLSARYIRITVITNWGDLPSNLDNRVGLSKVLFYDNAIAPSIKLATHSVSGDRITVQYSEALQPTSATNAANYTLLTGATPVAISNIVLNTYNDTVTITPATLNTNLVYTLSVNNVRDQADTVTFSSTPITVENELVLWLQADQGVTADGSGFVSQWNDQSGFNNNAVQPGGGTQPTLLPGTLNGKPVVRFDGLNSVMEVPNTLSSQANRDLSLFLVLSTDTLVPTPSAQSPISKCPLNVPATFDVQITKTSGKLRLLRGNGSGYSTFDGTSTLTVNNYYIMTVVMKETNIVEYLNGSFNGAGVGNAGLADSGTPIRLGIRQDAATKFIGNMAEVMMVRGAVTDSERGNIESYLGSKYGISVVALGVTSQPENATRYVGQTATFGVSAVSGSPTILYQWQKNGANIAGATNRIYTTPTLVIGDNNSTYRAVVSTPIGTTTTSSSATLTVLADTQAPTLLSAVFKTNSTTDVLVTFSEAVSATALNAANYSLNKGASVTGVTAGSSANQVILSTASLNGGAGFLLTVSGVSDVPNNVMTTASTLVLPSTLSIWLRADAGIYTNASGAVNEWTDNSPFRNTASQYFSPNARPTFFDNYINSKPAVHFNGSNYLEAANSPSLAFSTNITLYVVTRLAALPTDGYAHLLGKTVANLPGSFDYYVQNGANGMPLYRGNGTGYARVLATAIPSFEQPHVLTATMQGTTVSHFLDGTNNGSGTLVTNIADAGRALKIGSRDALDVFMNGEIAEVMIFSDAISSLDRRAIDSYLGFKYFTFSIVQQPQSTNVLEGQGATFSVVASAGSASFDYQWQKSGINIAGATNRTYTTPPLSQSDSGSSYRVMIIPLGGAAVLSDSATVNVSPDFEAPTVVSVGSQIYGTNKIVVVFSESVSLSSATNIANYMLDNGATITSAMMGSSSNQIILTVSALNPALIYSLTVQNVQDSFNNTISPVTVPNGVYPASLVVWLKADTGVTTDGQNHVLSWADQSGNGNTVSSVPGFEPTVVSSFGMPALQFDGLNNYLYENSTPSVALSGDLSIYVVAEFPNFTTPTNEIGLVEKSGGQLGNQPGSFDFYMLNPSGLPRLYRGNGIVNGFATAVNPPTINAPQLVSVTMAGQNVNFYLNGSANGSGIITAPLADAGGPLGIGTRQDLRPKMNGNMKEVMLFNASLSDVDRAAIDAYIGGRFNIQIGALPQLTYTALTGGSFTLSWPASATGFALESTSALGTAFTSATETVSTLNGTNNVTINASTGNKFYRLRKP